MSVNSNSIKVNPKVITLNIEGVKTTYTSLKWDNDLDNLKGGGYKVVHKKYDTPKICIECVMKVDAILEVGAIYSDLINSFIAISPNEIMLTPSPVDEFKIPERLMAVSKTFCK